MSLVNTSHGSGNFSNVVYLDLSQNENLVMNDLRWLLCLSSSLEFLNLELYLSSCLLDSMSPSLIYANVSSLEYLDLSYNDIFSELPNWLFNISGLSYLNLRKNRFHGKIPKNLLNLRNLHSLILRENKMSGTIPDWIGQFANLQNLNLYGNSLIRSIPDWFGQDMKALQLRSNEFSGDIPQQICQLSSLLVLDLANNRLTGTIPHCLHNITAMIPNNASRIEEFDITYINNKGIDIDIIINIDVPLLAKGNDLEYQKYMHVIDLSNNHLLGRIPLEVFRLTALQSLNLSQNQLMGTIPEEIGNMKQLESLDLSNNTLSGEIPETMSALSFLEVLNLSFNNLKGQIPLGTQLQSFTPLSYMGNPELCGTPLIEKCKNNEASKLMKNDEEGSELMEYFYMGLGVGFATGFWIVFGSLLFKRTWRHAYFNFLYDVKDWFMSKWS